MLPGSVDFSSPVVSWQSRVKVDGKVVEHLEWDVDRVMCHIPGDTDAAGRSADASVKPAPADPVVTVTGSPWQPVAGWPPRQGDAITIEVSQDGVTWFPVITGIADKPTGTLSGDMSVDIVEKIDRFSHGISLDPFQWQMYPTTPGADMRAVDLNHLWFLNRAMETAGFWTTMPPLGPPVLRLSMQGSRWPEVGTVLAATVKHTLGESRAYCAWGSCAVDFTAKYATKSTLTGTADLRVMVPSGKIRDDIPAATGEFVVGLSGPNGFIANLHVNVGARTASITTSTGQACTIGGITEIVAVRRSGTTWTLYSEGGGSASGTGGPESAYPINTVTVNATEKAAVGAIHLSPATGTAPPVAFTPTALFYGGAANISQLEASPPVDEQCSALMDDICHSTLSHWGFDETGRVIHVPIIGRLEITPARTISDDTDIIDDVTWSQDWQAAASQIHAVLKVPDRRWSTQPSIELWNAGGGTVAAGQTAVDVIHPDTDVDWIGVDPGHTLTSPTTSDRLWNGSIFGGTIDLPDSGSGPDDRAAWYAEYSGTVAYVDGSSYTITRTAKSTQQVSESFGDWSWLPKSLRKRSTPIVRGYQKTTWVDGWIDTDDNGSDAPVVEFDAGHWIGSSGSLTVQWLSQLLTVDRVTLSELEIRPDPRLQLGDNVRLRLTIAGVTVTGMITGKHLSFTGGILTMTISVLVTASTTDSVTWAAFEEYMADRTYAQLEARNSSYTALETDPLHVMGGS